MRISDWSSDVCSSDLRNRHAGFACGYYTIDVSELAQRLATRQARGFEGVRCNDEAAVQRGAGYPNPRGSRCSQLRYVDVVRDDWTSRSEEHTSELQSLMRISYAVFCLKKKKKTYRKHKDPDKHHKMDIHVYKRYYSHTIV